MLRHRYFVNAVENAEGICDLIWNSSGLKMRVGVLGGGLQGCCVALSLAERGVDVCLLDRNTRLLSPRGGSQ